MQHRDKPGSFLPKVVNPWLLWAWLWIPAITFSRLTYAQQTPDTRQRLDITGAVSVTNNGISTIPSFTLGKPAVQFDLSMGKRLSFDPQFRFRLDGRPWSFIFWWRYKLVSVERFQLSVGAHPAVSFRTTPVLVQDTPREVLVARRYWAGEVSPVYSVAGNIRVGAYYLYSYGVEKDAARHTHMVALRSTLSPIPLANGLFLRFTPQAYYLKTDYLDGFYLYSGLTLAHRNYPVSVSTIVNKTIRSDVAGSKDLIWNVSVQYVHRVQ